MSKQLDSAKMAEAIQKATQKMVAQTEAFMQSVDEKVLGEDTVSVMINGVKMKLNRADYEAMKAENDAVREDMKAQIKEQVDSFKEELNEETETEEE